MSRKLTIAYICISAIVALDWTIAAAKDVYEGSWLIFVSLPQSFIFWLVVVDGIAVLTGLKKKSGFENDGQGNRRPPEL